MSSKRIPIAEITTAHGIKGQVKVRSYADDPYALENYTLYTSETGDQTLTLTLKNAIKGDWIAEVKGITDRNAAEALRSTKLFIAREALPPLPAGQYYHADLICLSVVDENNALVGTVTAVQNFGAGDLLEVKTADGKNIYVPVSAMHMNGDRIMLPLLKDYAD
jgi:16S rRNA processing protein RimM